MYNLSENLSVHLENFFHLKAECNSNDKQLLFSYFLMKGQDVIEKTSYLRKDSFKFNLQEKGRYRIKVYCKDSTGNISSEISEEVIFEGFSEGVIPSHPKTIAIIGINKRTAAIRKILEKRYKVSSFVDLTGEYEGNTFFGLPIKAISDVEKGTTLVSFEPFEDDFPIEIVHMDVSISDILIQTMNKIGALDLYRIARECYLNGLLATANFIREFIFVKYNSFIPYTAEIGEGTKLGYGGIGVVIHSKAKIGQNCTITQNVTIGSRGLNPVIGDNVYISPGSKCIGGKIGSNVIVGANSVVTKEIPDNCVIAGVPAKIISQDISKYQKYLNKN